jgi:hypothetical protein
MLRLCCRLGAASNSTHGQHQLGYSRIRIKRELLVPNDLQSCFLLSEEDGAADRDNHRCSMVRRPAPAVRHNPPRRCVACSIVPVVCVEPERNALTLRPRNERDGEVDAAVSVDAAIDAELGVAAAVDGGRSEKIPRAADQERAAYHGSRTWTSAIAPKTRARRLGIHLRTEALTN